MLRHEGSYQKRLYTDLWWREQLVVSRNRRRRYSSYCGENRTGSGCQLIARDFKGVATLIRNGWQISRSSNSLQVKSGCHRWWTGFDGKVISWSLSTRPDAELVNTMLDSAVGNVKCWRTTGDTHSDRGGHYRWRAGWKEWIRQVLFAQCPVKDVHPDNAACRRFSADWKRKMYYGRKWSGITPEKVHAACRCLHQMDITSGV